MRIKIGLGQCGQLLAIGGLLWGTLCARLAAAPGLVDTSASPFARVRTVGLDEARWTRGFWAERFELCRQRTIPALWAIMEGTNYSQYYVNFQIAAGLAEGRHRGASFNDGDFYKWIESACAGLAVTPDAGLERQLDDIISVLARAQRADGYLHTPVLIRQKNGDPSAQPLHDRLQFEMYNLGHLITAGVVHYRVTGRTNLLAIACKAADFLDETFRQPTSELAHNSICPSHYMGAIELYRATRQPRYLELARRFYAMRDLVKDGTDDNQDRLPFTEQSCAMGHAVRANYLYAGVADLFLETGDPVLWKPLERIWTNVVEQKLYLTGGCGALFDGASPDGAADQKNITRIHQAYGRDYQLPNTTAHNETCANIGNVLWNWRMFLVTGEARFADILELALYNSVLSGVGLDGTNFFYVNPLRSSEPMPVALRWPHRRQPYLRSFCCPPNLARTLAESGAYSYGKSTNAIWVNLYGSGTLATDLAAGRRVRLRQETEYPWNGKIRIQLDECPGTAFTLKLRIPGWAESASLRLNHQPMDVAPRPGTYLDLHRDWRAGDIVELDLPMPVRMLEANPLVEEALNQVALKRGPLVYCLESVDLPKDVRWHQLRLTADLDLVARYDQRLLSGVVVLGGTAPAQPEEAWSGRLYRELRPTPPKNVKVRFIPYYAWANRGESEMSVWLPLAGSTAAPNSNVLRSQQPTH